MPAERAGVIIQPHKIPVLVTHFLQYTATVFVVDLSPSMAKTRTVEVPSDDGIVTLEMTNLEWGLQYVKLKIQEMVRRTGPDSSDYPPIPFPRRYTMAGKRTSAAWSYSERQACPIAACVACSGPSDLST